MPCFHTATENEVSAQHPHRTPSYPIITMKLSLRRIVHLDLMTRLLHRSILLLAIRDLLILLCEVARRTAARAETIRTRVALESIFCAHVAAPQHGKHKGYAEAREAAEGQALLDMLCVMKKEG
jgi:hypothetical protein